MEPSSTCKGLGPDNVLGLVSLGLWDRARCVRTAEASHQVATLGLVTL